VFDISKDNLLKDFIRFPKKNLLIILLLLGFGEWFVSDLIHFAGGSIGFFVLCLGGYFYLKNDKPKFNEPNNLDGWIKLCNEDLKLIDDTSKKIIAEFTNGIKNLSKFDRENLEPLVNELIKSNNTNFKGVGQPLRIALTGSKYGPGIYDIIISLGKDEVLKRLGNKIFI